MRTVEDHPEAAANLRRLLGEERWKQLVSPPFKLCIPSKLAKGCYWVITGQGKVRFYRPDDLDPHTDDQAIPICRGPAWGFKKGVPIADRILAMLLWSIADERAFWHRELPIVRFKGKGKLAQWDAIFEGGAGQGME